MSQPEWLLATRNAHKVEELQALLGEAVTLRSIEGLDLPELPETGSTFQDNAEQKARYVFERTGMPCLADDSGLEIEALDDRPGVDSAHYAGTRDAAANRKKVLAELDGTRHRAARFRCVLALVQDEGPARLFEGACPGHIAENELGQGGFGYDPIFTPDGYLLTFAQMKPEQKNALSHRALAVKHLRKWLEGGS